jgi:hypothetical protein
MMDAAAASLIREGAPSSSAKSSGRAKDEVMQRQPVRYRGRLNILMEGRPGAGPLAILM